MHRPAQYHRTFLESAALECGSNSDRLHYLTAFQWVYGMHWEQAAILTSKSLPSSESFAHCKNFPKCGDIAWYILLDGDT